MVHLSYQVEGSEVKRPLVGLLRQFQERWLSRREDPPLGWVVPSGGWPHRKRCYKDIACLPSDFCFLLVNASVPILCCHPSIASISASLSFRYELKITKLIAITEASSFVDGAAPGLCASAACCGPLGTT